MAATDRDSVTAQAALPGGLSTSPLKPLQRALRPEPADSQGAPS